MMSLAQSNLSRCEFCMGNYKQALAYIREAQIYFNQNPLKYYTSLEQEFYIVFAMQEYDHAVKIANKILAIVSREELGEFAFLKYSYLLANALFKLKKFPQAFTLLSKNKEISLDKAGWEIGVRILTVMTLIEMLKSDDASRAIRSLKRFFIRTEKKTPISERDKKILNLLLIAERNGFVFATLNGNTDKYMKPLSSDDRTVCWEPFTHEVIPFHEWFAGKMNVKTKTKRHLAV
jgi:tetratricopeptide (TPR) repeat protein